MEGASASKTAIIVAAIGAIGLIGAAVIHNLDDDGSATAPVVAENRSAAGAQPPEEEGKAAPEDRVPPASAEEPPRENPPAPVFTRTSIVELSEEGKAEHLGAFEGDYGPQSIGGRPYPNGVSMLVFSDGGQPKVAILTEGRFSTISGIVGIDGNAECIEVPASVSIVDDRGVVLWGPKTVHARSRVPFSADLQEAVRIYLTQASLESSEYECGANPAWGNVYLSGPPEA